MCCGQMEPPLPPRPKHPLSCHIPLAPSHELFTDMGEATGTQSVRKTPIANAFLEIGYAMVFLFDYGDEWLFRVELMERDVKVAKTRYPRVLAKAGPSPVQYPDPDDDEEDEDDA